MQAGRGRIMQKIRSQAADEQSSLPSRQPRSQATRQIGTCRQPSQQPTKERQEESKQGNKPASQPACQPSSQDTTQPASQPSSQPAKHKQKQSKQQGREAHRNSNTHSQAGALLLNCLVAPHRFQKEILLKNHWVRRSMAKSNEIQIGNHMETIFYGKSQKAGLSKARASLITTFFS